MTGTDQSQRGHMGDRLQVIEGMCTYVNAYYHQSRVLDDDFINLIRAVPVVRRDNPRDYDFFEAADKFNKKLLLLEI